jgi:hypothetical protein
MLSVPSARRALPGRTKGTQAISRAPQVHAGNGVKCRK